MDVELPYEMDNCSNFTSKEFHSHVMQTQRDRLGRIRSVCRHWQPHRNLTIAMLSHILVDDYHKLLYCSVPKVACTNWKKFFVYSSPHREGFKTPDVHNERFMKALGIRYLNTYSKNEIIDRIKHYYKFMFVRHPLERLLSAYKDKFTQYNKFTRHFQHKYARKIIWRYRKNASNESLLKGHDLTFPEFVKYLVDLEKNQESFNPHWEPYHDLCHPCRFAYNYVGKMETMKRDARYLLQIFTNDTSCRKLPSYLRQSPKTTRIMSQYYANVSQTDLHKLANIYALDFNLFGYDLSLSSFHIKR